MQVGVRGRGFCILHARFHVMHGFILVVCLHRGAVCNILALSLLTSYRVVLATALFSVAWYITYLCFGGRWRRRCLCMFCICLLSCVLLRACVPFLRDWGAQKSEAPRARTLLGVLGQATLSFFAVATLLFFFFCECPEFCNLAKQRRKIVLGVSEVGKDPWEVPSIGKNPMASKVQCRGGNPQPNASGETHPPDRRWTRWYFWLVWCANEAHGGGFARYWGARGGGGVSTTEAHGAGLALTRRTGGFGAGGGLGANDAQGGGVWR